MKNRGPLLEGLARGIASVIPERFLASVKINRTSQGVPNGTEADSTSTTVLESQVSIATRNEDRKENVERDAATPWPPLSGQEYDRQLNVGIPYEETIELAPGPIGDPAKEITPLNDKLSLVRSFDTSLISDVLDAILIQGYSPDRVSLPDKLVAAETIYSTETAYGIGIGGGKNRRAESSVSASIMPDLAYTVEHGYSGPVDGTIHLFYLPIGGVTKSAILDKIGGTVAVWPNIKLISQRLILTGRAKSLSTSIQNSASSWGTDKSTRVSVTVRAVNLPPTLHDTILIDDEEEVEVETVGVDPTAEQTYNESGWVFTEGSVGPPPVAGQWNWVDEDPVTVEVTNPLFAELTVAANVSASSIAATEFISFPVGTYLVDVNVSLYGYGYMQVYAKTVDITEDYV
jgi:hypothetical protein